MRSSFRGANAILLFFYPDACHPKKRFPFSPNMDQGTVWLCEGAIAGEGNAIPFGLPYGPPLLLLPFFQGGPLSLAFGPTQSIRRWRRAFPTYGPLSLDSDVIFGALIDTGELFPRMVVFLPVRSVTPSPPVFRDAPFFSFFTTFDLSRVFYSDPKRHPSIGQCCDFCGSIPNSRSEQTLVYSSGDPSFSSLVQS